MEIVLTSISDKNDIKNERVGFKVLKDCELKYYLLFKTYFGESGNFFGKSKDAFWFYPKTVKAGDKIVIYTKTGTDKVVVNPDGSETHFFYWGLSEPIYIDDNKGIVLVELKTWKTSKGL